MFRLTVDKRIFMNVKANFVKNYRNYDRMNSIFIIFSHEGLIDVDFDRRFLKLKSILTGGPCSNKFTFCPLGPGPGIRPSLFMVRLCKVY